jgi:hypothetical protein
MTSTLPSRHAAFLEALIEKLMQDDRFIAAPCWRKPRNGNIAPLASWKPATTLSVTRRQAITRSTPPAAQRKLTGGASSVKNCGGEEGMRGQQGEAAQRFPNIRKS